MHRAAVIREFGLDMPIEKPVAGKLDSLSKANRAELVKKAIEKLRRNPALKNLA
ncbi:TPA: hypothetical protein HA318_01215 [Candidatus Micrarchaeota archaeon]|nr:hypothetical protein [Candidatus Micrarchaeota archaeon]